MKIELEKQFAAAELDAKQKKSRFGAEVGRLLTALSSLFPAVVYERLWQCLVATEKGVEVSAPTQAQKFIDLTDSLVQPLQAIAAFVRVFNLIDDSPSFWMPAVPSLAQNIATPAKLAKHLRQGQRIDPEQANLVVAFLGVSLHFAVQRIMRFESIYFMAPTPADVIPVHVIKGLCYPQPEWPLHLLLKDQLLPDLREHVLEHIEFLNSSSEDDGFIEL